MSKPDNETPPALKGPEISYLKFRRKDNTLFLECNESDTVLYLKSQLERFYPGDIRLYHKGLMLDDPTSLYNQNIRNGSEIYVVTRSSSNDSGWETLEDAGYSEQK